MKWGFLGRSWNISHKKCLVQTHYWPKIYCNLCKVLEILGVTYVAPNCVGVMQSLDLRTDPAPIYVTGNLVPLSFNFIFGEMTLTLAGTVEGYEVCLLSICVWLHVFGVLFRGILLSPKWLQDQLQWVISAGRTIVVIQAKWIGVVRMINRCWRSRMKSSPFQNIPIVIVLVT